MHDVLIKVIQLTLTFKYNKILYDIHRHVQSLSNSVEIPCAAPKPSVLTFTRTFFETTFLTHSSVCRFGVFPFLFSSHARSVNSKLSLSLSLATVLSRQISKFFSDYPYTILFNSYNLSHTRLCRFTMLLYFLSSKSFVALIGTCVVNVIRVYLAPFALAPRASSISLLGRVLPYKVGPRMVLSISRFGSLRVIRFVTVHPRRLLIRLCTKQARRAFYFPRVAWVGTATGTSRSLPIGSADFGAD